MRPIDNSGVFTHKPQAACGKHLENTYGKAKLSVRYCPSDTTLQVGAVRADLFIYFVFLFFFFYLIKMRNAGRSGGFSRRCIYPNATK